MSSLPKFTTGFYLKDRFSVSLYLFVFKPLKTISLRSQLLLSHFLHTQWQEGSTCPQRCHGDGRIIFLVMPKGLITEKRRTRLGCSKNASVRKYSQYELLVHVCHYPFVSLLFPRQQNRMDVAHRKARLLLYTSSFFYWLHRPAVTLTGGATPCIVRRRWDYFTFYARPKNARKTRRAAAREERLAGALHQRKTMFVLVTLLSVIGPLGVLHAHLSIF